MNGKVLGLIWFISKWLLTENFMKGVLSFPILLIIVKHYKMHWAYVATL